MFSRAIVAFGLSLLPVLASLFLFADAVRADGVGITPAIVQFDDALRGAEYTKLATIVNREDKELTFRFTREGEVGEWSSVYSPDDRTIALETITVPANGQTHVLLQVAVPADVPNGPSEGSIGAQTVSGEDESGDAGVGVSLGVSVRLELNVTGTQNLDGSVLDMAAADVEVGFPLRIDTTFENTGNVKAQPDIVLRVKNGDDALVAETAYNEKTVDPGTAQTIRSEWDTSGQETGDYVADVTVSLGDKDIDQRTLPFQILPVGSFTRQGVLESLELENEPLAGDIAKLTARFRNTGQIDTHATFLGELYYGSTLVDTISSPERLVEMRQSISLEAFADVPEAGTYTVRGKVNYEGKETEVEEVTFAVPLPPSDSSGNDVPLIWIAGGGAVLGLAVVGSGGWVFRRRRRPSAR